MLRSQREIGCSPWSMRNEDRGGVFGREVFDGWEAFPHYRINRKIPEKRVIYTSQNGRIIEYIKTPIFVLLAST